MKSNLYGGKGDDYIVNPPNDGNENTGTDKIYYLNNAYGFVQPDQGGPDIFTITNDHGNLWYNNKVNTIKGGSGNDTIDGSIEGNLELGDFDGTADTDITGRSGNDYIVGNGTFIITDDDGNFGYDNTNIIKGGAGNDIITGASENDIIISNSRDDVIDIA